MKFVIVGGFAMMLHSASTVTFDLDIAIALDQVNGEALIRALAPFRPYPPQFGSADHFVWDDRSLIGAVMALKSTAGHIGILRVLPEVDSFEGLFDRSIVKVLNGEEIRVASIDDLTVMKAAAGRSKD